MTENDSVLVIAVFAVIASLAAAGFSYYAMSEGPKVSGFLSNTDTGTASLTVESVLEIEFTDDTVAFGSGRVATGQASATLYTNGTIVNGNWTAESTGLVLENKGNVNASTLTLSATKTAATLLGGTSPQYNWKVSSADSACTSAISSYTAVNSSAVACNQFGYLDSADTLRIDFELVVPMDSLKGALSDTITATAAP